MGASEKAVAAVMETLYDLIVDDPMWIDSVGRPLHPSSEREARIAEFLDRAAVAAADAAVDTDRPGIQAQALREAADEFGSAQLTGLFTRDEYPRAWLRARADRLESQP